MLSRILWAGAAGLALLTGMMLQNGASFFPWRHQSEVTASTEQVLEARIEKTIDRTFHKTDVVTVDGREIHVSRAQKDAMANAIGRLAKADAQLVALKIRNAAPEELAAAKAERDQANTEVAQIQSGMSVQGDAQQATRDAIRERIQAEIRDDVREAAHN